ncbi:MAG: prepilin-type N-terminal cleavage/methylation domain-containing protein [bacterium]|nr:prepilin-type N-terminal cleavage/methylation domain-containing protein [bacterium]
MPNNNPIRKPHGLTLVELMVVLVIIGILIGVSVPLIRPHLQDKSIREAAREVNGYVAMAKARAAESGRPVGISIQRSGNTAQTASTAFILHLVETPPPYAGDISSARATVTSVDNTNGIATVSVSAAENGALPSLVFIGDRIRFNYRGGWYDITSNPTASGGNYVFNISLPQSASFPSERYPMPPQGPQLAYQILRAPQRALGRSVELPKNSCIDLSGSGVDLNEFHGGTTTPDSSPVGIMFDPTGRISTIYIAGAPFSPSGAVHLLIGRPDRITPTDPVGPGSNIVEPGAKWVTINHATGLVTTADIVDVSTTANNVATRLNQSRRLAKNSQTTGGG